jgi:hypothetical protein
VSSDPIRPLIDDLELAKTVISGDGAVCAIGRLRRPGRQPKKIVSCTGGVFFGRRNEAWPIDDHGLPLIPWFQLVERDQPLLWNRVHCKKAVCFFISQSFGFWDQGHATTQHGKFVAREYERFDHLRPLERPSLLKGHRFRRITWRKGYDYPPLQKYHRVFSPRVLAALRRDREPFAHHCGIKIEGWPSRECDGAADIAVWDLQLTVNKNLSLGGRYYASLARDSNGWCIDTNALQP